MSGGSVPLAKIIWLINRVLLVMSVILYEILINPMVSVFKKKTSNSMSLIGIVLASSLPSIIDELRTETTCENHVALVWTNKSPTF